MRNCLFVILLLSALNLLTAVGSRAQEKTNVEYSFCGRIGATDQEAQEGYFAIDNQTMIVVKPGSDRHNYFRSKVGQRMCLTVTPEPEPT